MNAFDPTVAKHQAPTSQSQIIPPNSQTDAKKPQVNKIANETLNHSQNPPVKALTDHEVKEIKLSKSNEQQGDEELSDDLENSFSTDSFELDFLTDAVVDVAETIKVVEKNILPTGIPNEGIKVGNYRQDLEELGISYSADPVRDLAETKEIQKILNEILSNKDKTVLLSKIFENQNGKFKVYSAKDAHLNVLSRAINEDRIAHVINGRLFLDPNCGLRRGQSIDVEDENGNTQTYIVDHYDTQQLSKLKETFTEYLDYRITQQASQDKKNLKNDQKLPEENPSPNQLNPNKKLRSQEEAKPNEMITRSSTLTKKEIDRRKDEEAGLLRAQQRKEDIAFERKKTILNREVLKDEVELGGNKKKIVDDDTTTTMQAPVKNHPPQRTPSSVREKIVKKNISKTLE
ncbi:MAG: hypothetical protein ACHQUC_07400 [Chlamydiales bacterium]